jgi:hypothetical protein
MLDAALGTERHHLMIAGTGRAGTTFLVRYLTELGLDTYLSHHADAQMDHYANAGFEELPISGDPAALPYVIKSPWLHEYADELLQSVQLDAVIVPVRELGEAASSRVLVERDAMHRASPWLAKHGTAWDSWGWSPGGALVSLDPVDQARLLAVGFHGLIERLVRDDVPIIFLSFPRMALDAAYLFRKLRSVMPRGTTEKVALAAHARVADTGKIRVDAELAMPVPERPDSRDLDMIAVRRQLQRMRDELELIKTSRAWRITLPLRRLNTWVHGLMTRHRGGNRYLS